MHDDHSGKAFPCSRLAYAATPVHQKWIVSFFLVGTILGVVDLMGYILEGRWGMTIFGLACFGANLIILRETVTWLAALQEDLRARDQAIADGMLREFP